MNTLTKILLVMLVATMITTTGCGKKENKEDKKGTEEETKVNTNTDVIKDQTIDVFKFENTSLVYTEGTTTLETIVTNTSSEDKMLQEFKILVKDSNGNEMITLTGFIGDTLKAGESRVINSFCGEDLTQATSIEYTVVE